MVWDMNNEENFTFIWDCLINQTWDGSQKYFRVKNEDPTIIKEDIDYFGDDYAKWKYWR